MKNNLNQNSEQLSQNILDWNIIQDNMREKFGEDIFQSWLKKLFPKTKHELILIISQINSARCFSKEFM